jgi:DNA-binding NarL/FixJ family response regulator
MEQPTTMTSDVTTGDIAVVLIGSERVTRAGLRMLLDSSPGLRVTGEFESPDDARVWAAGQPQIAVIDIDRPGTAALIPDLRDRDAARTRIIVLTSTPDSEDCLRTVQRGVLGVVSKQQAPEVLIKAIERVHAGEAWVNRAKIAGVLGELRASVMARTAQPDKPPTLMPRERQIITLVGQGFRNSEIAASILVSEATVRNCLGSVFKKVGVTNRVQLMLYAIREGFVNLPAAGDPPVSPREVLRLATSAGRLLGNRRTRQSAT